jgi:hypothetical protein
MILFSKVLQSQHNSGKEKNQYLNGGSSIQWNFKFYFEFLSPNAREGEGT